MNPGKRETTRDQIRRDNHLRIVNAYQTTIFDILKDYEYMNVFSDQMWLANYVTHPGTTYILLKLFCLRHGINQSVAFKPEDIAVFIEEIQECEFIQYCNDHGIDRCIDELTPSAKFLSGCFKHTIHSGIASFVSKCASKAEVVSSPPGISENDLWSKMVEEDEDADYSAAALLQDDRQSSPVEEVVTKELPPEEMKLYQHTYEEVEQFDIPMPLTCETHEELVERVISTIQPRLIVYAPPNSGKSIIIKELAFIGINAFDTDEIELWNDKPDIVFTDKPSILKYAKTAYAFIPSRDEFESRCRARQLCYSSGWYDEALTWSRSVNCCYTDRKLDLKSRFFFYCPVKLKAVG